MYYRSSSAIGRIRDKSHRFAFDRSLTKICNRYLLYLDNIIGESGVRCATG